jgi:hypothetical protein
VPDHCFSVPINCIEITDRHTLGIRELVIIIIVYNGFKFCPSLFETVGIHVLIRNFRDFPLFTVG